MTADAKVGLLLGLILIVVIAFMINGLPNIVKSEPSVEVATTSIINEKQSSLVIGRTTTEIARTVDMILPSTKTATQDHEIMEHDKIRYVSKFSGDVDVLSSNASSSSLAKSDSHSYMVQPGDNLAIIAIKVYGKDYGNKNTIVQRIFQANRSCLKSSDQLQVGQKLFIPPLAFEKQSVDKLLKTNMLTKIKTLFNGISNRSEQNNYIVKQGDSLWRIAENVLGDGNRHREILNLNLDVISDSDEIEVGMILKLPSH